jgi:hypothetical protein
MDHVQNCGSYINPSSVTNLLQRFQNMVLRALVDAPWCVPNRVLHKDLGIQTVREEVMLNSKKKYQARLQAHPNALATHLLLEDANARRLHRFHPVDLLTRFT